MVRLRRRDPDPSGPDRRTCELTGLRLRRPPAEATTRIAKPSYGPLNVILRGGRSGDRAAWGRYDVAVHRTIHAADPIEAAYAESVAAQRLAQSLATKTIGDIFAENAGDRDGMDRLLEVAEQEWSERRH